MYIIKLEAYENGSRPALQKWSGLTPPKGYALCPDAFHDVFYANEKANGFVNIIVRNDTVVYMEENTEAVEAYISSLPELEPESEEPVDPIVELQEENQRLNAKIKALTESNAFLEDCIVEMAEVVYA
jgi:hypothetical protein